MKVKCPKCDGDGEIYSGYHNHPETSEGGPLMWKCGVCNGKGKVEESVAMKWKNSRSIDLC